MKIDSKKLQEALKEAAIQKLKAQDLIECFTHENLKSRPAEKQWEFFDSINTPRIRYRYLRGGNQSSKTSSGVREFTWVMEETHPRWERPNNKYCHICKSDNFEVIGAAGAETYICNDCTHVWKDWGDLPISAIISGQDRTNMDLNLWQKRIKPLLTRPDEWKEIRNPQLVAAINKVTGAQIIFMPHSYSVEDARKACQGYTMMLAWFDELPPPEVIEEIQRRVDAMYGYCLGTFTPKFINPRIKRLINQQVMAKIALEMTFSKYDNPIYMLKDYEKSKLMGQTTDKIATIEEGEWPVEEDSVYSFNYDAMTVESLPEGYSRAWPHMLSVDPAMANKMGLLITTLDRSTGFWYTVEAFYIQGEQAPSLLVRTVHDICSSFNIVERVADSHEGWYITEAHHQFPLERYRIPWNKTNRKKELIKGFQQALTDGWFKILRKHIDLVDEIETCKFTSAGDKIVHATKYHLLDSCQYFVDTRPLTISEPVVKNYFEEKRDYTKKYYAEQERKKNKKRSIWGFNKSYKGKRLW